MYLCSLCLALLVISAPWSSESISSPSSRHTSFRVCLMRCGKIGTFSPSPLIKCSASIWYQILFHPSKSLLMNFALTLSHVVTIKMVFSYHSEADPRSNEKIIFFSLWKRTRIPGSAGVPPREKLFFSSHLIEWKIRHYGQDFCQKIFQGSGGGMQDEYLRLYRFINQKIQNSPTALQKNEVGESSGGIQGLRRFCTEVLIGI